MWVSESAKASPGCKVGSGSLFISGMNPTVRRRYRWQARASGCWLAPVIKNMGDFGVAGGSGGGKFNRGGWRGLGSRGYRAALVSHIPGFFTVGGDV